MTSQTSELVELLRDLTDDHRIPRCYARQAERLLERLSSSEVTEEMVEAGMDAALTYGVGPEDCRAIYIAMRSAAIEALSASTQVDAMREALEEAREAIGIYGYATVHGRRVRQSWATEALAKIDAALLSLPPGGEATSPAAQEDI